MGKQAFEQNPCGGLDLGAVVESILIANGSLQVKLRVNREGPPSRFRIGQQYEFEALMEGVIRIDRQPEGKIVIQGYAGTLILTPGKPLSPATSA